MKFRIDESSCMLRLISILPLKYHIGTIVNVSYTNKKIENLNSLIIDFIII